MNNNAGVPGAGPCRPPGTLAAGRHESAADVSQVEFAACYQAEMPVLVRFLMKCGAGPLDAMDAAQNAFILLYEQWATVRRPRQWLRTVAFRIFLKMPVTGDQPLGAEHDRASDLAASDYLELQEQERDVLAAFRRLPLTQRAVFALYYDNFPVREIAEILQMKEAAVRQNIARARTNLKKLLGTQDGRFPARYPSSSRRSSGGLDRTKDAPPRRG